MSGSDRQHSQPLWLLAVLVLGFASVAGCGNCKAPLSRANPSVSQSDAKLSYSRFIEQNDRKRYSKSALTRAGVCVGAAGSIMDGCSVPHLGEHKHLGPPVLG